MNKDKIDEDFWDLMLDNKDAKFKGIYESEGRNDITWKTKL
jgi:hypothetical protein